MPEENQNPEQMGDINTDDLLEDTSVGDSTESIDELSGVSKDGNTLTATMYTTEPSPQTSELTTEPTSGGLNSTITTPLVGTTGLANPLKQAWWRTKALPIVVAIAVGVVVLSGVSVYAYTQYQKPDKVVADALINIFTAEKATYTGSIEYNYSSKGDYGSDTNIKVKVEVKSRLANAGQQDHNAKVTFSNGDKKYSIEGDALFDKSGDIYFRVQGLKSLVDDMKSSLGSYMDTKTSATIDEIVEKLDGTWVRISTEDLKAFDENYSKTKKCVNDAFDKFKTDQAAINEIFDLYRKYPYITIKKDLGLINGNYVYEVSTDFNNGKEFTLGLSNTKIYKTLHDCDKDSFNIDTESVRNSKEYKDTNSSTKEELSNKLSINMWSHKIAKFEYNYKSTYSSDYGYSSTSDGSVVITPDYNSDVNIKAPTKYISLTEFKKYLEDLFGSSYANTTNHAKSTQAQANANIIQSAAEVYFTENDHYPATTNAFYQTAAIEVPTDINIVKNPSSINSSNGENTIAWQCMDSCSSSRGGRVTYYDFVGNTVKYIYVGAAIDTSRFVDPTS